MSQLFEFQHESIHRIRKLLSQGLTKIGLQLSTGAGKTFIAKQIIVSCLGNKKKVGFILHGNKLMDQTIKVFERFQFGLIWSHKTKHAGRNFLIISHRSLIAQFDKYREIIESLDVIIIDEAHDCTSPGYELLLNNLKKGTIVIGLSASFLKKSDGKAHEYWEKVFEPITKKELLAIGRLPELEIIAPDIDYTLEGVRDTKSANPDYNRSDLYKAMCKSTTLYGDVIQNYYKYNTKKEPSIAFCINIKHCTEVANLFRREKIQPLVIHSKLSKEQKKNFEFNLRHYLQHKTPFIICSVDMLSRGVDIPELKFGFHLRPTKSKLKWVQQVGRLTRKVNPDPKVNERKILIDFTPNYHMHGSPYLQFDPDIESEAEIRKKKKAANSPKRCKMCDAVNPIWASHCVVCDASLLADIEIEYVETELRRASLEERDEKLEKYLKQQKFVKKKYNKTDEWLYDRVLKRFKSDLFIASKHVPEEYKKKEVKKILDGKKRV